MKKLVIIGKAVSGRGWTKIFLCFGNERSIKLCEQCKLRFECFSGREDIKIELDKLEHNYCEPSEIDAGSIVKFIKPEWQKFVIGEDHIGHKKVSVAKGEYE